MLGYDLYLKMLMWQMMTKLAPFTDSSLIIISYFIIVSCETDEACCYYSRPELSVSVVIISDNSRFTTSN